MIGWVAREGARFWLGKRVRVGAGCAPEMTMAEGVVVSYLPAPSVTVRDEQGRDSTWVVTLPIDVLGEVPAEELPERAVDTAGRSRELRSQLYEWLGARTSKLVGEQHDHASLRRLSEELAQRIEQLPMPIENKLGEILRGAGIEHPLGLRGVRDLVNQRDGYLEGSQELAQHILAMRVDLDQVRQRAEEAERRLANAREMANRLRNAAGGGVTPGYALVRIEDMLNGQEPT